MLITFNSIKAQIFQISANSYNSILSGDLSEKDMTKDGSGYVDFVYGFSLEAKYYIKDFGLGVKWGASEYLRDVDSYNHDLKNLLGITDDQYSITQVDAFWSHNVSLGISYNLNLSDKIQLEPYFSIGVKTFLSPGEHAVYSKNNTTYTYRKDPAVYTGLSYTPGIKFKYNFTRNIGINVFAEYEGVSLNDGTEEIINYSYNSFDIRYVDKAYNPQLFNVGLGLAYSFGKGTRN